jgi:hypothetical protein
LLIVFALRVSLFTAPSAIAGRAGPGHRAIEMKNSSAKTEHVRISALAGFTPGSLTAARRRSTPARWKLISNGIFQIIVINTRFFAKN